MFSSIHESLFAKHATKSLFDYIVHLYVVSYRNYINITIDLVKMK